MILALKSTPILKADEKKAKMKEEQGQLKKQQANKAEPMQKEADKGSEQGQEARQERKKWWRFWGE